MRHLLCTLALLVSHAALAGSSPGAHYVTGNELYRACTTGSRDCAGYVAGVLDAAAYFRVFSVMRHGQASDAVQACVPDPVPVVQVVDVVTDYLRTHPRERNSGAASLVLDAAREVWPCDTQPSR